jgi:putative tryptophan/tyrosine transport system substrate-binding protein
MRRREFIGLIGAALAWPRYAIGQQTEQARLIGILQGLAASDPEAQRRIVTLDRTLRELGWIDGSNVRIEYRWAAGDADRFGTYAAELVRLAPDVILAAGTAALTALARETKAIPIVFVSVSDPVGLHFITSLSHPGGNITGFANFETAMGGKWLELLKEMAPNVARVAFIFNPATAPISEAILRSLELAASSLSARMIPAPVHNAADIETAISSIDREPGGSFIVGPDTFTYVHRERIAALAARHRLPAVYPLRGFTASGGLLSYGIEQNEQLAQAAIYIDRIFRGAKPGDLPVQAPTKFELVVNLKTAKALGITIPPSLLVRADEVIE